MWSIQYAVSWCGHVIADFACPETAEMTLRSAEGCYISIGPSQHQITDFSRIARLKLNFDVSSARSVFSCSLFLIRKKNSIFVWTEQEQIAKEAGAVPSLEKSQLPQEEPGVISGPAGTPGCRQILEGSCAAPASSRSNLPVYLLKVPSQENVLGGRRQSKL